MTARLAIFVGSFVVFLLEPLVANVLMPVFGGTATVWTVTLATFQALLLVGYAWAHGLAHPVHTNRLLQHVHVAVLAASGGWLVVLPVSADSLVGAIRDALSPMLAVFVAVTALVGVPFVLLSANASFVQALTAKDRSGYNLYSVSNLGSFAGLLAYPLLFEPFLDIDRQLRFAGVIVFVYVALLVWLMQSEVPFKSFSTCTSQRVCGAVAKATRKTVWLWLSLSALSTFVLNAVTAHVCLEIAPLPMMWVLILALYLLSYVIAFTRRGCRWGLATGYPLMMLALMAAWYASPMNGQSFLGEVALVLCLLFIGCWNLHAKLYSLRPDAAELTRYYLVLAVGGAIGGVISSMACPLALDSMLEYPVALALLLAIPLEAALRQVKADRRLVLVAVAAVGLFAAWRSSICDGEVLLRSRNFYGVTEVRRKPSVDAQGRPLGTEVHELVDNGTTHGKQIYAGSLGSSLPTTYYTPSGGGVAIERHPRRLRREPIRAAFLGMGIGTLASYGNEGDTFRFFEINPDVVKIARETSHFSFLEQSLAHVEVLVDDARNALSEERRVKAEKYDLIVVDVFSGDSIPAHLATEEALDLYLDRLKDDGVLAFHLTNWHLNLLPMAKAMSRARNLDLFGYVGHGVGYESDTTIWACLSRRKLELGKAPDRQTIDFSAIKDIPLMTDKLHSLVPYLSSAPFVNVPCLE